MQYRLFFPFQRSSYSDLKSLVKPLERGIEIDRVQEFLVMVGGRCDLLWTSKMVGWTATKTVVKTFVLVQIRLIEIRQR